MIFEDVNYNEQAQGRIHSFAFVITVMNIRVS
jgi:hypothetical protein